MFWKCFRESLCFGKGSFRLLESQDTETIIVNEATYVGDPGEEPSVDVESC